MELDDYLREIECLVLHLSPQAQLLGEMDLHVAEELWATRVPLEAALAGIRKGALRLARLKRPPRGLPLRRVRRDIAREVRRAQQRSAGAPGDGANPAEAPGDPAWRRAVEAMARGAGEPWSTRLRALAADDSLGEERAFLRVVAVARDYYSAALDALGNARREALVGEVERASAPVLDRMAPAAREDLLLELVRRRLMTQDPVLDPQRFWQE